MKSLVAFSASALAMNCTDSGCGFQTVDPLPFPGGSSFCGGFNATFKVSVRPFPRNADVPDATTDDDAGVPDDAGDDAGDAADAADADDAADAGDAGNTTPVVDAGPAPQVRPRILLSMELRPGTTGLSLKSGAVSMLNESGTSKIVETRASELLVEMEIEIDATESFFDIRVDEIGDCFGSPTTAILSFDVENGRVKKLEGTFGGSVENVSFTP
jgi:hypothetical protein